MSTSTMTLPATQIKEPLNAFQVFREIKQIKDALAKLPIYSGNDAPEGEVHAQLGAIYLKDTGQIFLKSSDDGLKTGWTEINSGGYAIGLWGP